MNFEIFNNAIHIDNIVVSMNSHGSRKATPVKLLEKRKIKYNHLPHMTYGNRLIDNQMIQDLLLGTITFDDAMNTGTPVMN